MPSNPSTVCDQDIQVEESAGFVEPQATDESTTTAEATPAETETASKKAVSSDERRPRSQRRRAGVYMVETRMPDGVNSRVLQILDFPVDFSIHPEFVQAMNRFREEKFGEKGKLYVTKNDPIPEANPEISVHFAFIHTQSGKISGVKIFTKPEAREHLQKLRDENHKYRETLRNRAGTGEFGTNVHEAIQRAASQKTARETGVKAAASI